MTLVMNQLLDSKLTEVDEEEEKGNKSTEKQGDDALVLWDSVSLFDTEDENSLKQEDNALVLWDHVSLFDTEDENSLK